MKKRRNYSILPAIVAVFLFLSACSNSGEKKNSVMEPPSTAGNPVEAFGVIKPAGSGGISLELPLKLVKLNVTEGQQVKRGDVLAGIDLTGYHEKMKEVADEISRLERDLKHRRTIYTDDSAALKQEQFPEIQRMQNSLAGMNIEYTAAQKNYALKESLALEGSIPSGELEDAGRLVQQKKNAVRDIELQLESWKASEKKELVGQEEEIIRLEDQLDKLRTDLGQMAQKLDNSCLQGNQIVCPLEKAIISKIPCSEGSGLDADVRLFELLDTGSLIIEANVDEQFISLIKPGATATIVPDADKSLLFTGKVAFISSLAVTNNGETIIPVQISLNDASDFLMPGFNVSVKIDAKK